MNAEATTLDRTFAAAWGRPAGLRDLLARLTLAYPPLEPPVWLPSEVDACRALRAPRIVGPLGEEAHG